jgi:hypothetical protein
MDQSIPRVVAGVEYVVYEEVIPSQRLRPLTDVADVEVPVWLICQALQNLPQG